MLKDWERHFWDLLRSSETQSQALKPRQRWRMECKRSRNQPSKYRSSSKWKKEWRERARRMNEYRNLWRWAVKGWHDLYALRSKPPTTGVALRWCASAGSHAPQPQGSYTKQRIWEELKAGLLNTMMLLAVLWGTNRTHPSHSKWWSCSHHRIDRP